MKKHEALTDLQLEQHGGPAVRDAYRALREHHVEETTQLADRLTQARLDLFNSDTIRGEMVEAARQTAGHVVHALELLEAAFHAGAKYECENPSAKQPRKSIDQAFRDWFKENG